VGLESRHSTSVGRLARDCVIGSPSASGSDDQMTPRPRSPRGGDARAQSRCASRGGCARAPRAVHTHHARAATHSPRSLRRSKLHSRAAHTSARGSLIRTQPPPRTQPTHPHAARGPRIGQAHSAHGQAHLSRGHARAALTVIFVGRCRRMPPGAKSWTKTSCSRRAGASCGGARPMQSPTSLPSPIKTARCGLRRIDAERDEVLLVYSSTGKSFISFSGRRGSLRLHPSRLYGGRASPGRPLARSLRPPIALCRLPCLHAPRPNDQRAEWAARGHLFRPCPSSRSNIASLVRTPPPRRSEVLVLLPAPAVGTHPSTRR